MPENEQRIGLISDTHGMLRPEAIEALRGSSLIIHAGDIGAPEVLDALRSIAPVTAVRGNVDTDAWCRKLPATELVTSGELSLFVLHNIADLDIVPSAAGAGAVIYGHSHTPLIRSEQGVLFINPGSAGPKRFRLPVTVARLLVSGSRLAASIITLEK